MQLSRCGAVARLLAVAWLAAAACGGTPPPVLQPADANTQAAAGTRLASTDTPASLPTASLSGRVVTTGEPPAPIGRARVILTSETLAAPRVVITAEDGRFLFEQLPAASYVLTASASGYATQAHLQRGTLAPPPVVLADAQHLTELDIPLPRAGVIVGQILDEDDRPFVGATVNALVARTIEGQARLLALSSATSDDRGRFRLAGLPAGHYYVSAFDPSFLNVGDDEGPLRYTPTYYPGVLFVEQATRVSVTPGIEPEKALVLKLQLVRPARVSGIIALTDRSRLARGAVILAPVHGEGLGAVPSTDGQLLPDGRFMFRNVPPGTYQIRARAEIGSLDVTLFGRYRVSVNGRDISKIAIELVPGASMRGTVSYEPVHGAPPPGFDRLRVRAPFVDGTSFGDAVTGNVAPDGAYHIPGLMMGTHAVMVEGLQAPWVLKTVVWQGRNITDVPIEVESRERFEDVRLTLTDAASEVRGLVRDPRGRPVPGALVLLIPSSSQFWTRTSRRFGVLTTTGDGTYRLRGLPPGEYRVVATAEFDESEIYRKEILRDFAAEGKPLALQEQQSVVLDLGLTPLSALDRSPAR